MIVKRNKMIRDNITAIRRQIDETAQGCGRKGEEIRLMLVSKTVTPARIKEALAAGETLIGENKIQELAGKYDELSAIAHETHMIGQLQTNKVKEAIAYADCIQSLDRLRLVTRLHNRLEFEDKSINALLQVNVSAEASKSGVPPEQAMALLEAILPLERIRLQGLMTIGANSDDENEVRRGFRLLKQLQRQAQDRFGDYGDFSVLSMGMSGDMRIAIEEGSTMVRVGSAIFGARQS